MDGWMDGEVPYILHPFISIHVHKYKDTDSISRRGFARGGMLVSRRKGQRTG